MSARTPELDLVIETASRKLAEPSSLDQALGRELLELALELAAADVAFALERVNELRARWLDAADLVDKLADTLEGGNHDHAA